MSKQPRFMCMVLHREPMRLSEQVVADALSQATDTTEWEMGPIKGSGALCEIRIGPRKFGIIAPPIGVPLETLSSALSQPVSETLRTDVEDHRGHLAITALDRVETMEEAVATAATIQMLAWQVGGIRKPVAAYWAGSEGLWAWSQFSSEAKLLSATLGNDDTVVPSRFWVSTRLRQEAESYGGKTRGLAAFTGYELDLTPLVWPIEAVAHRLTAVVDYVFKHGPILKNGQSVGITEDEVFRIEMDHAGAVLRLSLEEAI